MPSSRSIGRVFFFFLLIIFYIWQMQNQTVYRRWTDVRCCQLLPGKRIHLPAEGAVGQPQYSLHTSQCIYLCQSSYTFVVVVVYYHFPGRAVICRAVVVIRVTAIRPRSAIDPDATGTRHGFFKTSVWNNDTHNNNTIHNNNNNNKNNEDDNIIRYIIL